MDLNPYHLSPTRLKLAAIAYLPDHDSFYDFFGYADLPHNVQNYERYIKPERDEELESFWSGHSLSGKKRINLFRDGLYRHTRFGYFMRFLYWIARRSNMRQ